MKKTLLLLLLIPSFSFCQIQIGQDIDGEAIDDQSGTSISLSSNGNIVAIGALLNDGISESGSGHVRVYEFNGVDTWVQIGQDIDGEAIDDNSGESISLSSDGSIVAIGARLNDANGFLSGHVRVYEYNGIDTWIQIGQDIDGEGVGDASGTSISLSSDGSIVAIGAPGNDANGSNSGHVRVYEYNGIDTWAQLGQDIDGEAVSDFSGQDVSLSSNGNIVAVGARFNDANGTQSGHVRVYEYNGVDTWVQLGQDIDGEAADDLSGISVSLSLDGNTIAIGAIGNSVNGENSGHVRVYEYNGVDTWTQVGQDIDGQTAGDFFGFNLSLSSNGNIIVIGAPLNDENGVDSGQVRIYQNISNVWTQIGNEINGESIGDQSGFGISLSSDGAIVAIGANLNNGANGENSGHVRIYNISPATLSTSDFKLESFVMYPNPTSDIINIELSQGSQLEKVSIYNILGQVLQVQTTNKVDLSKLSTGNYYVEVITNNGKATKQIIVD